jgi:hypothetical protein
VKRLLLLIAYVSLYAGHGSYDEGGGESAVAQSGGAEAPEPHHHHHHEEGSDNDSGSNGAGFRASTKTPISKNVDNSVRSSMTSNTIKPSSSYNIDQADVFLTNERRLEEESKLLAQIRLTADPVSIINTIPIPTRSYIQSIIQGTDLESFAGRFQTVLNILDETSSIKNKNELEKAFNSVNNRTDYVVNVLYNLARFLKVCKNPITSYKRGLVILQDPYRGGVFRIRVEDLAAGFPASFLYELALPHKKYPA